jgi:hypothetical protein
MTAPVLPSSQVMESVEPVWGIPFQPAGCSSCKQVFLVASNYLGSRCPDCGQGQLAAQPALLRPEPPELLIPFQKNPSDLQPILTSFVKGVWLHPDDFKPEIMAQRLVKVYWPMWLVDSNISGDWQAEVGFDYQVESAQESYSNSGWHSRNVIENRIRWEPRLGLIERHYDNIASPASSDHQRRLNQIGNYRLNQTAPYQPDQVRSAVLKVPDLPPESAWPPAQSNLNRIAANECQQACAAQHVRNYTIHASYDNLHWTQLLMPMFFTFYTDDAGLPHPILINGQTGVIGGVRLASQKKGWRWAGISVGISVIFLILALFCFAVSVAVPPLAFIGFLLAVIAFIGFAFAVIPAVWPWQWNRKQQEHKITSS